MTLSLIPNAIERNLGWWLFGIILVVGVAFGAKDLFLRFSWKRIWAIGSVCWTEAWRRRIWLIPPLAFLGVVIISQLQRPLDEQDAIRQTTKFCIFATGLVVAVTTIILACTNLPREIENRVIYSLVTKPTTRLEIVLGKVVGFATVSFTILLIMGVLSFGYLAVRAKLMQRYIAQRLETGAVGGMSSAATLNYYRETGLLSAKQLEEADALDVYARLPDAAESKRYFYGWGDGSMLVAFDINPAEITPAGGDGGQSGLAVRVALGYAKIDPARLKAAANAATAPAAGAAASTGPTSKPYYGPFLMSPEERALVMAGRNPAAFPVVSIEVMDANQNHVGNAVPIGPSRPFELTNRDGLSVVEAYIEPKPAATLKGRIYIKITGMSADTEYYADLKQTPFPIALASQAAGKLLPPAKTPDGKEITPIFQARQGNSGQSLRGGTRSPTAFYQFRGASYSLEDGKAPFELRSGVERSGADDEEDEGPIDGDRPTQVAVQVQNLAANTLSDEIILQPESNRTVFFRVPEDAIAGGDFNVLVRTLSRGDHLGITPGSLVLIAAQQTFAWNLAKSLFILWLMTVLIAAVAVFCSTFLSWPIAVVLTLVILLGHWGVGQLGDSIAPGIGAQVVTDLGLKEAAKAEAVRATVERLSRFLNFISAILPDIAQYAAVEDIERGVAIPFSKVRAALLVTLGFSVPLVLLSYVFLKNKEVAP
ncbi:MAG: hypothetical protein ABIP55_02195 [Tepidisphaeraceae bacterium]